MVDFFPRNEPVLVSLFLVLVLSLGSGCVSTAPADRGDEVGISVYKSNSQANDLSVSITFSNTGGEDTTNTVNNSVVWKRTMNLDAGESFNSSFQNPSEPGSGEVSVAIAGDERLSESIPLGEGSGIIHVEIVISPEGEVDISTSVE